MDNKFKSIIMNIALTIYPFISLFFKLMILGLVMLFFFMAGVMAGTKKCEARTIYFGSEMEKVTIVYGGPTIFRFNEEVKTISQASKFSIKPTDNKDPNYSLLSVTPRFSSGKNRVSFILAGGAVINTEIAIVPKEIPEKTDSFYDFQPKDLLIDRKNKGNAKGSNISELELMKAMIRWDSVVGYNIRSITRTINTGVRGLEAKLVRVYTGPNFNGYVFKIRNRSKKNNYAIDLKSLTLDQPNVAVLSQVDRKILKTIKTKENVTFLRVVAKPTSVYYNINLPIAAIKRK